MGIKHCNITYSFGGIMKWDPFVSGGKTLDANLW